MGPVYYFASHTFNTISSGALKYYVGFQKFTSEPLEHPDFFLGYHPTILRTI